jgi:hypothetical protein
MTPRIFHAPIFELALQFSYIREFIQLLGIAIPARIEDKNILVEHVLK